MELVEKLQKFKSNFEQEETNTSCYRRKKLFFLIAVAVVVLIVICVGVLASSSASEDLNKPDSQPNYLKVLPYLKWDGACPKKILECPESFKGPPPLILVSLDGFHPDFMNRGFTPTLKNISQCGAHASHMYPVFPSKTFPNHYSLVTGLYPSSHGIIDNNMYDPYRKKLFKVGTPESLQPYWWSKEPIWVTAQKQGKRSGLFFWPGSEVKINNTHATYFKKYNSKISFSSRVDQLLSWLELPASLRPHFLTLYVNQPDHTIHYFGTNSKQTNDALSKVDKMIARLFSGLQQQDLLNCVNIIIVSDHGLSNTDCKRVIDIQKYINVNDTFNTVGPFGRIRPKGRKNATLINEILLKLKCKSPHMRAYAKEQLPVRMHYTENPRIEPIFLDIDAGWTIVSKTAKVNDSICSGGSHGYDNLFSDMQALFLGYGPSFNQNYTVGSFLNVELYELLAELIEITPNPNNGTKGSLHHVLKFPRTLTQPEEPKSPAIGFVPSEETITNQRLSATRCFCPELSVQKNVQDISTVRNVHLPFGVLFSEDNDDVLLLYNDDYISAFHLKFKTPLWSAFTLKEGKEYNVIKDICWKGDSRISEENAIKCDELDNFAKINSHFLPCSLYPLGFSHPSTREQGTYTTNLIIKSLNHSKIIENSFNHMLSQWVTDTGELNVIMGPAFNFQANEIHPHNKHIKKFQEENIMLVPTHIFAVTTWCKLKHSSLSMCNPSDLESQAFLLPNEPYPINCEGSEKVILKNVARVTDVENLSGISFYTNLPIYEAIRLKTQMPERSE